ncbi:acyltransferase family protein [Lutimonas halocynthiae]|uniref:acyltransferase family protein n=1 Tax=Lutimonas halocynthiae TaxID=1446477 RepID=UPI0025B3B1D6|nr:acyltransferase family protein [Lutimonas halocynthiae]MDN3641073.1 acyltransferase family protein [Lutimonas halocynthiae]
MDVNLNSDILSFESIDNFKGLLIVLVIFGHIKGLTSINFQSVLYSFHVSSFLFLPFLFNKDKLSLENIFKIFRRIYIPYSIFYIISLVSYSIVYNMNIGVGQTFNSWFIGTSFFLRESIGISAYWFFPALFFLLLTIMTYNSLSEKMRYVFLFIMLIGHLVIGHYSGPNYDILRFFPLSFYVTFYLFGLGILIKIIVKNVQFKIPLIIFVSAILFISCYYAFGKNFNLATPIIPGYDDLLDLVLRDLIMISAFILLLYISKSISYLSFIGKNSISIYCIHPLIIQFLLLFTKSEVLWVLILKFVFVIFLSIGISLLLKVIRLNTYFFPR